MWTDERITELRKLWGEGISSGIIARQFNTTRNAVIGKVHRLDLPARVTLVSAARRRDRRTTYRQRHKSRLAIKRSGNGHHTYTRKIKSQEAPVTPKPVPLPEPAGLDLALMDLKPGQCRWAHGDGPFLFCGAAANDGKAYCAHHHARAYQPAESQRRTNSNVRYLMRYA